MQVTRIRKGMLWTLVLVLLCTMLPVAMAAQTTLSVSFNGLRATSEGQWMTEPLTGTFEVWSGTTLLGQVAAHPQDGSADALALSSTEEITLRPVSYTHLPAIFTDEPQFSRKSCLGFAADAKDVILPWSDDVPDTFRQAWG